MGHTTYSSYNASSRVLVNNWNDLNTDQIFEQTKVRRIHELMDPRTIKLRECRDSANHPYSFPIIIALDITGSMRDMPKYFLTKGLNALISKIIEAGFNDPSILIVAVGDSLRDAAPLQVGQFESGDEELEFWLTKIWPEGGGGGNNGESYMLPWYFAANRTVTDSWEKRGQKGLIITIGDEAVHSKLTSRELISFLGESEAVTLETKDILKQAQEKYDVYHMHMLQGTEGVETLGSWKTLLGENCIPVSNYTDTPELIANLVIDKTKNLISSNVVASDKSPVVDLTPEFR